MNKPYILCAAIHFDDDIPHVHQPRNILTGIVFCGYRHHNIFAALSEAGIDRHSLGTETQGFVTSDNRFLNRREAAEFALAAGQINEVKKNLFSEDLY